MGRFGEGVRVCVRGGFLGKGGMEDERVCVEEDFCER